VAKISLIIPIYNEAQHLEAFLTRIDALDLGIEKELIFVDDCSKDSSLKILQAHQLTSKNLIIAQTPNQGKGAALRAGFAAATGELIVVQDADFEYDPSDLKTLIEPLVADKADVVFGSRFKKDARQVHRTFHYLVNRILTLLSNLFSGLYLTDMETCYKLFRAEIIKNIVLTSDRFGFEPEVTAKLARLKVRVYELPISYFPRRYIEGKKITWRDGIAAVWHIVRYNLLAKPKEMFRSTMPTKYLSQGGQWL
jgi:glycosyltransferase involved in cell wall biosynthesis